MDIPRTLNLHHALISGPSQRQVATVKGYIHLQYIGDTPSHLDDSPASAMIPKEHSNANIPVLLDSPHLPHARAIHSGAVKLERDDASYQIPLLQSWVPESVTLHVYILTARHLTNLNNTSIHSVYPSIQVMNAAIPTTGER